MRTVFLDAGHFIGLLHPKDDVHEKARALARELDAAALVTTEMVLVEVLNYFGEKGEELRRAAAQFVAKIRENPRVSVHPQTSFQFDRALARYADRPDKPWSITDCPSFLVMEREGIFEAATHDHHFEQAGFKALLRGP